MGKKMKVEYEKVECDIWDIATLKDDFEKGLLYRAPEWKLKFTKHLSLCVAEFGCVYRRIETPVTLESELFSIVEVDSFGDEYIRFKDGDDFVRIDFETIEKICEIRKKYGK